MPDDYKTVLQGMLVEGRTRWRETVANVLIDADPEVLAFADALERAIGEISVDEATEALVGFMVERAVGDA